MALRDYERKRFFQGWCSGRYVAERETWGSIPLYQETLTVRITRFDASQCIPITQAEYDAFEHDLDGGYLADGDYTWYGTLYRHQAHGLRVRSVAGPQGVTRVGTRTYGEFAGPFVGYVTEVVQLEVPDVPPPVPEPTPEPTPEPRTPEPPVRKERVTPQSLSTGQEVAGLFFRLVGGVFAFWSLIAILGALPGLLIGLGCVLLIVSITNLLGRVFGGLLRYALQASISLLSLLLLLGLGLGLISFLFGHGDTRFKARTQGNTQRTTKREVKDGSSATMDTSIVNYLRWHDNSRVAHAMEWEVLRSECLRSLVHLRQMDRSRTDPMGWAWIYDRLRIQDSIPLSRLAAAFAALQRKEQLPNERLADVVVTCVQSIPYSLILESSCPSPGTAERGSRPCKGMMPYGVNPPSLFMGDLAGDCDTRALLLVAVLQRLGFDATILLSEHYHHAMLGLAMPSRGASISRNGRSYYFWETTNTGFRLGEIHPDCSDLSQWSIVDL